MTILRLQFSGKIHKAEHKQAGDKAICEVSICKKVPAKGQDAERYDWVRITIWAPPEWAVARLVKGNYISGSGEMALRPWEKDGVKKVSLEVRCGSYDFEAEALAEREDGAPQQAAPPVRTPVPRHATPEEDASSPPF